MIDFLSNALVIGGATLALLAGVGVLRMPDVFTRMQASTKASTLGLGCLLAGVALGGDAAFYFLCLAFLIAGTWLTGNLLRAPTGRAWVAIRDSEIAAQSMGVNLAVYKTSAFAYSAALMGAAGALFAHKIGFLAPDIFTVLLSIQFLLMVVVGGFLVLSHGAAVAPFIYTIF